MRHKKLLAMALLAMLAWLMPASAAVVINGGFEQPILTQPFQKIDPGDGTLVGWDLWSGSVALYQDSAILPAMSGNQSLLIFGGDVLELEQVFPTSPGQSYTLSIGLSTAIPWQTAYINYELSGVGLIEIGQIVTNDGPDNYLVVERTFTAESTLTSLLFSTVADPSKCDLEIAILDDIHIRETPIPELPSGFLAGLGLLGLIVYRSRR